MDLDAYSSHLPFLQPTAMLEEHQALPVPGPDINRGGHRWHPVFQRVCDLDSHSSPLRCVALVSGRLSRPDDYVRHPLCPQSDRVLR